MHTRLLKTTATAFAALWASFVKTEESHLSPTAAAAYQDPKNRRVIRGLWRMRFIAAMTDDQEIAHKLRAA
jgi:hypothetical protein